MLARTASANHKGEVEQREVIPTRRKEEEGDAVLRAAPKSEFTWQMTSDEDCLDEVCTVVNINEAQAARLSVLKHFILAAHFIHVKKSVYWLKLV